MGVMESTRRRGSLDSPTTGAAGHAALLDSEGAVVMRLRAIDQLFDAVDPSPFGQQDLSQWAAEYILESVKEMQVPVPSEIVVVIDEPCDPGAIPVISNAVREFFARQAEVHRRSLRRLLQRGLITLAIGVVFLVAFFGFSRFIAWLLGDGPVASLLREGSLIVGWVAMWRPIEIFLYDWWPIAGERRLLARLSGVDVRVVAPGAGSAASGAEIQSTAAAAQAIQRWENEGGRIYPREERRMHPLPRRTPRSGR